MRFYKPHRAWFFFSLMLGLLSCESGYNSEAILDCPDSSDVNFTLDQLHQRAGETAVEIRDSVSVSAIVISNDQHGNMFNELILQGASRASDLGIRIEMELRDSYLRFPVGAEVRIQLNGLWIHKKHGILSLGKPFMIFGNLSVGRIPYHAIDSHIQAACQIHKVQPHSTSIDAISSFEPNTLIQIREVEFLQQEIGLSLAGEREETTRNLTDCENREFRVITSGYSDFYDRAIPDAKGSITGILLADSKGSFLRIRSWEDIQFDSPRCRIPIEPVTSNQLFISEIADPDNAPEARFVELYNSSDVDIPLNGWQLIRYTNANTEPGSSVDLSGFKIGAHQAFVIAGDQAEFSNVFGISADLEGGKNSAADSNGDDTMILMDPFGAIIDIFGRIGEDGSGTDHEFEDGRAVRKSEIVRANSDFFPSEWLIFNDTGAAGTVKDPQQAPEDFTPGIKD